MFDMTDRVALVTGSSRGIGLALAAAFGFQGASVALHGRAESAELESARQHPQGSGVQVSTVLGDMSDTLAVRKLVEDAASNFGRLDILVNNAGFVAPVRVGDLDEASWDAVVDVNLRGAFFAAQVAAEVMKINDFGGIINISSQAAEVSIPSYLHH